MKNCRVGVACPTHGHVSAIRGNNYGQGGLTYHFSYDHDDQQNFADTDNVALLAKMGGKSDLVRLNFTAESFLTLYTGGAVDPQGCAGTQHQASANPAGSGHVACWMAYLSFWAMKITV